MPQATHSVRTGQALAARVHHPCRRQEWHGLSHHEILDRTPVGKTPPRKVLDLLIALFNHQHTARQKDVSFKTRQERADFLRRFFRDLQHKAGFKTLPDPRNLGQRHLRAIVAIWQAERLAPATIQTYFSYLRGLASWIGKPGLVRQPAYYRMAVGEFQRHEAAQRDHSWSAQRIAIDPLIDQVSRFDPHVGAALRLIRTMGLRRKEAVMLRPHHCVVPFEATGLPLQNKKAEYYLHIRAGSKGGRERFIALDAPERIAAVDHAQSVVGTRDGHVGQPSHSLKQALRRFNYVLEKFGVTHNALGVTAHGLRHEASIAQYETITGHPAPMRGGHKLPSALDALAQQEVAALAGHVRKRAANAYLGQSIATCSKSEQSRSNPNADDSVSPGQ